MLADFLKPCHSGTPKPAGKHLPATNESELHGSGLVLRLFTPWNGAIK
jgi:hypothetical protein